jgi:hypothetical protein
VQGFTCVNHQTGHELPIHRQPDGRRSFPKGVHKPSTDHLEPAHDKS